MLKSDAAGRVITRIYAVLVALLGCALTLIGLMMFGVMHIGSEPVPIIAALILPGLAFVALGVFIWLRKAWALSAAWVLALLYWLLLWSQNPSFLLFIVIPIAFGALALPALLYRLGPGGVRAASSKDGVP